MKQLIIIFVSLFIAQGVMSQENFSVTIAPLIINDAPGIHSYAWGKTSDGKWIILGGRLDGLHQRQPFAAFLSSNNNKDVFLIDPDNNQVTSTFLGTLPASIFEQLQSTNQEFYQRGNTLYIMGGYGYSESVGDHITYPYLTAVNLDGLAAAMLDGSDIISYFRQIPDERLAETGGQLGYLDGTFYLCGGQFFDGRYNPMGPNHGPGFTQEYSDEIRKFEIMDDGTNLSIQNYVAVNDPQNLHRRDYNMAPQIFPSGEKGFTMFSGVFQYDVDLPWLNSVDITNSGYEVNNDFAQYLSQYHSAKVPIFDAENNAMHTIFFGGMSQFSLNDEGNLIEDTSVPFVKTISRVTRGADGMMTESELDIEMPSLLGAGAEFIPVFDDDLYLDEEILNLNLLPFNEDILVGYIYGGIESTQGNIFFINTGSESSASKQIFKVFINKTISANEELTIRGDNIYNLEVFPNPMKEAFYVSYFMPNKAQHVLEVYNILGLKIEEIALPQRKGEQAVQVNLPDLPAGEYLVVLKGGQYMAKAKILKQ